MTTSSPTDFDTSVVAPTAETTVVTSPVRSSSAHDGSSSQNDNPSTSASTTSNSSTSTPAAPKPVSAWASKGLSFADLLKQNMDSAASAAKIKTGVPIMSIPASSVTPSTVSHSQDSKKKKQRQVSAPPSHGITNTPSSGKKESRLSAPHVSGDKTPNMNRAMPESPVSSSADSPSAFATSASSSKAHLPSPPMSEIASDENQPQFTASSPPAVNVWQVRMAQNMASGSSVGNDDHDATPIESASGTDGVDGLLDAVEKKLAMATSSNDGSSSDPAEGGAAESGEKFGDDGSGYRRKYSSQSQYPRQTRGGSMGMGRGGRTRGSYNGGMVGGSPRYYGVRNQQQAYVYPVIDVETLKFYLLGQIEYYFSVENLCRDVFFRKQMDENGWIPLNLIANFNRVKAFTTDMSLIKEAVSQSVVLEMHEESIRKKGDWHLWVLPKSEPGVEASRAETAGVAATP